MSCCGNAKCSEESPFYRTFLHGCDIICTVFLFFPLMVMYWRGIWDLWGVYVYPDDVSKRHLAIIPIGSLGIIGYLGAPAVEQWLNSMKESSSILYGAIVRIYLYSFAMFYMCYWRAIWETADFYLPGGTWQNGLGWAICWLSLVFMRACRTAIFPPYLISLDTRDEVLTVGTRFGTKPYTYKFVMDCLFTYFIIITITILTWRCSWNFITDLIMPDDPYKSDIVCLIVGSVLALFIFSLEAPLKRVTLRAEKKGFWVKLVWEDVVYFFVYIACLILWRGAWNCCVTYIIPNPRIGGWVCHISGTVGLMLVQLFSYAGALGCGHDGKDPGAGAIFPIHYFREYLLQEENDIEIADKKGSDQPMLKQTITETTIVDLPSKEDGANWKLLNRNLQAKEVVP